MISWLEQVAGELHATFRVRPAAMCARAGCKACGAWLRCQRAVARPGRTTSRRVELPNSDPAPQVWRAPEGPEGTGGLRGAAPEGPEGTASVPVGGGRARAGLEIDHSEPSGSRVAISRAGRRPPAHTAAGPHKASQRSARNTSGATSNTTTRHRNTTPGIQKTDIRIGCQPVVELGGFEPPTFSLRTRRATNCAIAPRTQTA